VISEIKGIDAAAVAIAAGIVAGGDIGGVADAAEGTTIGSADAVCRPTADEDTPAKALDGELAFGGVQVCFVANEADTRTTCVPAIMSCKAMCCSSNSGHR
jgi:hypothetical protein